MRTPQDSSPSWPRAAIEMQRDRPDRLDLGLLMHLAMVVAACSSTRGPTLGREPFSEAGDLGGELAGADAKPAHDGGDDADATGGAGGSPPNDVGDPNAGAGGEPFDGGAAGRTPGCAGHGEGGSPTQYVRVPDCDAGGCGDGGICSKVTDEHWICANVPGEATERDFGSLNDECGVPGRVCPSGQVCRRTRLSLGAGAGQPQYVKRCGNDACLQNEDCPPGQVCQPPLDVPFGLTTFNAFFRCMPAECRRDSDCVCGGCAVSCVDSEQNACAPRAAVRGFPLTYRDEHHR